MRWQRMHVALVIGGMLLLFGWSTLSAQGSALARPLWQSPRPTLTPIPRPTLTPAPPTPILKDGDDNSTSLPSGRITGTVIDLTSRAPAPGVAVSVGDIAVTTDAHGNYDRNGLQPGSYVVALVLMEGQGVPVQEPITVELAPGATVVQHLAFRSQPRATPTSTTVAMQAPDRPVALPATGGLRNDQWVWVLIGIALIIGGARVRHAVRRKR